MSILRRIANLFRRSKLDQDIEAELRSHIEMRTADNIVAGMSPKEARRQAVLRFGSRPAMKERVIAADAHMFLDSLWQDLCYGVRVLRKSPGFTAVAVLTLALGIGANTAIFSVIDAVLLRSLPVKDPQQLVVLRWSAHSKPKVHGFSGYGDCVDQKCSFSLPFFRIMDAQAKAFSGMAAFAGPLDMDFSGNGEASIAHGTFVSGDFFSTLGVNAFIGRPLTASDDTPSAPPAIVLTYAYWQRAFGGDRSVIGRSVHLDNVAVTIIGVADPRFTNLTPGNTQDFFLPCSLADRVKGEWWGNQSRTSETDIWWVIALGRLKPGVSISQAQAEATAIFRNEMLHGASPAFKDADAPEIHLLPAQAGLNGETSQIAPILYLLMIGVGFILLIACANVAGLMLARSATRQKEMSVRLALGAGRARLVRQLLTESVLLSVIGAAFGILFAAWGVRAFIELFSSGYVQFPFAVAPDWRVLTFTIGVTLITGILFGLAPALRGTRVDLTPSLKENASSLPGTAVHARRFFRLGNALVVTQVALSIVVLIGAGLLVRTMRNLHNLNPGFDARNILIFNIDPTIAGYSDQQTQELYSNLQQRFAAIPGVSSVSYSEDALLDGGHSGDDVHLDGAPPKQNVSTGILPVGLNFFSTMHIPLLAGRTLMSADFATAISTNAAQHALGAVATKQHSVPDSAAAAALASAQQAYTHSASVPVLINETFAKKILSKQNPVGLHMGDGQNSDDEVQHPGPGYTIVGIVGDTKYAYLRRPIEPMMFLPLVSNSAYFELRAAGNPTALVKNVRDIVSRAGENLPLTNVRTQTEQIEQTLYLERLLSRLSSFFGALALVLACIGLYGLLAYEVARRTREIGIRMALGAQQRDLLRLIVGQGILLAVIGSALGIAAALGVTRFISSMLFGVRANDPLTIVAVAILLAVVALLACYIPARRAMRVDPMVALRYE
ncbi:MAG TPA: ABC transporter permease [Candidatus Acidoferrales bacterium]|nr:ABC transporter permease [Candidatus Acidoferrales bacterium]